MVELQEAQDLATGLLIVSIIAIIFVIWNIRLNKKISILAFQAYQVVGAMSEKYEDDNKEIIRALDYFHGATYGSHKIKEGFLPFCPTLQKEERKEVYVYLVRRIGTESWNFCDEDFYEQAYNNPDLDTMRLVKVKED